MSKNPKITQIAMNGYNIRPGEALFQKGFTPTSAGPLQAIPASIPNPGPSVQPPPAKLKGD